MNPKVDEFMRKAPKWREEMGKLRSILLECDLNEDLKWGKPCYSSEKGNIVLIQGFKEYCALLFFKGALLQDPQGILITQTENTQSARQIRFTSPEEITEGEVVLKAYIDEAIQVELSGMKVEFKDTAEYKVPEEFQRKLDQLPALNTAFKALTPGRQRAYLLYFSGAKQSKTRESRIEKYIQQILDGKGLND